jgi:hypothetical protein
MIKKAQTVDQLCMIFYHYTTLNFIITFHTVYYSALHVSSSPGTDKLSLCGTGFMASGKNADIAPYAYFSVMPNM